MLKWFLKMAATVTYCFFLGTGLMNTTYIWADADSLRHAINDNQIRVASPEVIKNWRQKRIELYG